MKKPALKTQTILKIELSGPVGRNYIGWKDDQVGGLVHFLINFFLIVQTIILFNVTSLSFVTIKNRFYFSSLL